MDPVLTETLRRRCLSLPVEDRAALAGALLNSLEKTHPANTEKADLLAHLRQIILTAWGQDVKNHSRHQPLPDIRSAFVVCALEALPTMTNGDLARYLGILPCSVTYHEKRMRDALKYMGANPPLVQRYLELKKAI